MKTTLLLSIILTGLVTAGCSHTARTSTPAGDGYQNPPAADPKVAVDPTKPNSPSNTVEGAARASEAAATTGPSPATGPTIASTPSNISTRSPAVVTSNSAGAPGANYSTTDTAADTSSPDINTRIAEWRLGAAEVQGDVDGGVTIVRRMESVPGTPNGNNDDASITTQVKGKLQADAEVSTAMVDVQAYAGEVTLKGTADTAAQVGHAIALALDTQGVTKVSADIKVAPTAK